MRPQSKFALLPALILTCALLPATSALAAAAFVWDTPVQAVVSDLAETAEFLGTVTNTGDADDTLHITMVRTMTAPWFGQICANGSCYSPAVFEVDISTRIGISEPLDIHITPLNSQGEGWCEITVSSTADPSVYETRIFKVITSGLDVLLVDNDGGDTYETYYQDTLTGANKTYGTWDANELGKPVVGDLESFDTVVWFAGDHLPGLTSFDRVDLAYFVQHGGDLFLTGKDVAHASCDPASADYDAAAPGWFSTVLGTSYLTRDSGGTSALGVGGDPVGDGLSFAINGGTGADNNDTPDRIGVAGSGVISFNYDNVTGAAIRSSYGTGKTVFCAFGYEGIATASDRQSLMDNVLDWLDAPTPTGDVATPLLVRAPLASPNPFNPLTAIEFEVGGDRAVLAEIVVYDLRGQAVRHLYSGSVNPGPVSLAWNGRDNGGRVLATGVYLAQVKVGGQNSTVKMTLAK